MINSIYGNDSLEVTTALPNRLYEACMFKKPIISSRDTYLGEAFFNHFFKNCDFIIFDKLVKNFTYQLSS